MTDQQFPVDVVINQQFSPITSLLEKNVVEMSDEELEQHVKQLRELSTKDEEIVKLISGKRKTIKTKKPVVNTDMLKDLGL
jgi:succinate dehydrogenase flavin-adding protein (antitoxin of CptAB toxin-antitoxin module)